MLSVENQLAWMPSTIGAGAGTPKPSQELALSAPAPTADDSGYSLFGDDGFSFADLIDVVNPLQHIPLVSTYYRETTGDEIAAAPRVVGSTLFFGPLGLVSALANVFVEGSTGKDIGAHMASWVSPDDSDMAPDTEPGAALANNTVMATDPDDPVLAWARAESDWTKQQARARDDAAEKAKNPAPSHGPATPARHDETVPDATPLLRDAQPAPVGIAQLAVLSDDIRSAARAYEVAANLRPAG